MPPTATVPSAPQFLPADIQKKWQAEYSKAYAQAKSDHPDEDESSFRQAATVEANRMLRIPAPESYADAVKLADWQVVFREVVKGELKVVTSDGKKYSFPAPATKSTTPAPTTPAA